MEDFYGKQRKYGSLEKNWIHEEWLKQNINLKSLIVEILVSGKTGHMEETRPAFVHLWGRRPYNICSLLPNVSTSKYVHETTKKDGLISHMKTSPQLEQQIGQFSTEKAKLYTIFTCFSS